MKNLLDYAVRCMAIACMGVFVSGCATHGVILNKEQGAVPDPNNYSLLDRQVQNDENLVILALSGGGTRAAAFSYGVLQELRDTTVNAPNGESVRLLDGIDIISSVSGGSFVAAYYGLYGDNIFTNFEKRFLRKNVQGHLLRTMYYNPFQWFSQIARTQQAVKYYQKLLFKDKTFADLKRRNGPLILINTSDLTYGVRFSFIQEYFNLLGSDIATFPIAEAVAASSAVPVLFDPVVVRNYPSPNIKENSPWLTAFEKRVEASKNSDQEMLAGGMESYADKVNHKFVHFVDGGVTDNLGLRAIYDIMELGGGIETYKKNTAQSLSSTSSVAHLKRIIVILVNAATHHPKTMDRENREPSMIEMMSATSSLQLSRYSDATLSLMENSLKLWAEQLSTKDHPVSSHFIHVRFENEKNPLLRKLFDSLPTSFVLPGNQVDDLIKGGRSLLRDNPDFQQLLKEAQRHAID